MRRLAAGLVVLSALLISVGCEPQDRRPGLWLRGEVSAVPPDWSFTRAHKEIAVQVATPYLLPHSVTVWCSDVDGDLYLAAFDPDSKNWPGWVRDDSQVRLKIDARIYDVTLQELMDADVIGPVQQAYAQKYDRRRHV
jgi:hypothetical protein